MIINTNRSEDQQLTIEYIRSLSYNLPSKQQREEQSDSLALSASEPDSLNIRNQIIDHIKPIRRKNETKRENSNKYVSPYRQSSLSMKKIMQPKRKKQLNMKPFIEVINSPPEKKIVSKSSKKYNSPSRYMQIPFRHPNQQKSLERQLKEEATQLFSTNRVSNKEKKEKWADFLLRERRWQTQKQDRLLVAEQKLLAEERQNFRKDFTPRKCPKMNIEEHIRLINRKKTKLKEELKSHLLNYYTYQNPLSLISPERSKQKQHLVRSQPRPKSPMSVQSIKDKIVHLKTDKEVDFLVDKNR